MAAKSLLALVSIFSVTVNLMSFQQASHLGPLSPANETPFGWLFAGGPMVARLIRHAFWDSLCTQSFRRSFRNIRFYNCKWGVKPSVCYSNDRVKFATKRTVHKISLSNKITTGKFSSKDWWKTVKLLLGKDNNDDIPPLLLNGQPINDPNDKANAFNHYFHSQTQLDDSNVPLPELSQPDSILSSIELTTDEVESTLKSLAIGKACGPDQINNRILKELAIELSPPLTDLFNTSLMQCTVPDIWKRTYVSPVHKKDDKGSVDNYRPISLLSSVGKTMEKLVINMCITIY